MSTGIWCCVEKDFGVVSTGVWCCVEKDFGVVSTGISCCVEESGVESRRVWCCVKRSLVLRQQEAILDEKICHICLRLSASVGHSLISA